MMAVPKNIIQLKKLKTGTLQQGDCIALLNASRPGIADLIVADPPYNIGYEYDVYNDRKSKEEYLQWSKQWVSACERTLKPGGSLWIAIGDEYAAELKQIAESVGLTLRNWVIWYYTFGVHCNLKYSRSHTHLLYFVRDANKFTFNADEVRVPSARQLIYNDKRANGTGRVPDNTWILRPQDVDEYGFEADHDTWYIPRIAGTFRERADFHGCQLPEQLLGRIIRGCSNVGDVVLDPFAGTGSTLVTARKLNRKWIGCELSETYRNHAQARIDAVRAGDRLNGAEEPLTSARRVSVRPQRRATPSGLDEARIIEAFREATETLSIDRFLADPVLNQRFIDSCSRMRLPGRPADWIRAVVGLRKNGRGADLHSGRSDSSEAAERVDPDSCEFACEMALRRMLDEGFYSLDDVLCEPEAALRFDTYCRSLCPGFTSFQYRWTTLNLRKKADDWKPGKSPKDWMSRLKRPIPVQRASMDEVPAVYVIRTGDDRAVYAGYTENLRSRIDATLIAMETACQWMPPSGDWTISVDIPGRDLRSNDQFDRQRQLVLQFRPPLNYSKRSDRDRSSQVDQTT